MKLYNTLSRQTEDFKPIQSDKVSLYTCGLTVYSQPHIGNWVAYIYWDILVRTLRASGYNVERVQNITDVGHLTSDEDAGEDKMLKGALREGLTAWQVAEKYIEIADHEAYDLLGLIRPEHMPRATDYIPQQIAFVEELEKKGFTYVIDDGVYFDTSKLQNYGELARLDIKGLQFGARVADTGKKNPTDFAVWKFSNPAEKRDMEWWAPWSPREYTDEVHPVGYSRASQSNAMQGDGEKRTETYNNTLKGASQPATQQRAESIGSVGGSADEQDNAVRGSWGFPGWHLECSVMAREILGDHIDIHTGGIDHIPVHHTNEIAQTEAITGKKFADYWLHANHIKVDGTKMSKSLGNVYTLQDIIDKGYDLQAFKLLVLSKHYRTEGNFTWEILDAAQSRLKNWQAVADLRWQLQPIVIKNASIVFEEKLEDDLNTPQTVSFIDDILGNDPFANSQNAPPLNFLVKIRDLLGIDLLKPDITDDQKRLIKDRETARKNKDWVKSDELRDQLKELGIEVRDTPGGTIWSRA